MLDPSCVLSVLTSLNYTYADLGQLAIDIKLPPECGLPKIPGLAKNFPNNDVLHGTSPWTVRIADSEEDSFFIGSLIHPKVVMTTASKSFQKNPGAFTVFAGESEIRVRSLPANVRDVVKVVTHPNYSQMNPFKYNVALLILGNSFSISDHIAPICLPDIDELFENREDCIETGWLKLRDNNIPKAMKSKYPKIIDDLTCSDMRQDVGLAPNFNTPSFCGLYSDGLDICWTLSGSPLVCPTANGGYVIAGMASWYIADDDRCHASGTPRGYTDVSKVRHWVNSELKTQGLEQIETTLTTTQL